ncbi:hypothetical protein ACFLW6_02465 [Chloroflexota bacterium]
MRALALSIGCIRLGHQSAALYAGGRFALASSTGNGNAHGGDTASRYAKSVARAIV